MYFKLIIIILLISFTFINGYLSCNNIEKFIDIDREQSNSINNITGKMFKLENEIVKKENDFYPIKRQIGKVDNKITQLENKIKKNNTLSLSERNSNTIRNENNNLKRYRSRLINYRNRLQRKINYQRRIINSQRRRITQQRNTEKNLKWTNHVLRLKHNGLSFPGYILLYDYRRRLIGTVRTNNAKDNFKNYNGYRILRRVCYCKVSPGFKVKLFNNNRWNSKQQLTISGGDRGFYINLRSPKLNNRRYIRYRWRNRTRRCNYSYWRRHRRWRWHCRRGWYKQRYNWYQRWCGHIRSLRLERIIDNNYKVGVTQQQF